jgi:general secretion pathway protein M
MSWFHAHRRSAWIIAATLLVPLLLYLYLFSAIWGQRAAYQSQIDRLQPRVARLQGLLDYEQQLLQSSGMVDAQIGELVYSAADDAATISTTLQKDIRKILVDAGLSVTNSQVLPVNSNEEGFDYVRLRVTVSGAVSGLDTALGEFAAYTPLLLVESMDVSPAPQARRNKRRNKKE